MKIFNYLSLFLILIFLTLAPNNLSAKEKEGSTKGKANRAVFFKSAAGPSQSLMDINGVTMWVTAEGFHDWVVGGGWNGAYPNGKTVGAIFAEGIVWGGQVNDGETPLVRVDGNTYGTGTSPIVKQVFRARPDFKTGDIRQDVADFNDVSVGQVSDADVQAMRDQYQYDWNNWPANEGAPYQDVNNDGQYDPAVDIPGIPGAAQTLFIKYDDAISTSNYGSKPIGLEVSETYWAYAYSGPLGNVIYKKVNMIYKGTVNSKPDSKIDSMYIVQWADPDVGNSTDDFAGCDTTLNLGFAYNANPTDATYSGFGLPVPAVGYDFLQGVSIQTNDPADSALFNLKYRHGYKYVNRKPMSSYVYFAAGGTWSDPPFTYNGSLQFYNLMRGVRPTPAYPDYSPFPTTVADYISDGVYLLPGDPVKGTGKLDGNVDGPGDRRIMVTNGPITMNLHDTAQVVLALVYGMGKDNLSSVAALKYNDNSAQIVYDQLFQLPSIDPPSVQVANLDQKIILNWGSDPKSMAKIENFSDQNYSFEGYQVFQLPSSSSTLADGILLGTYDLVDGVTAIYDTTIDANGMIIPQLTVPGADKGVQRFITIDQDNIRKTALRNGQDYYFAVVSYAYNPAPLLPFHALLSKVNILTCTPQQPLGIRLNSSQGDTIKVTHTKGSSDGNVIPLVVDPSRVDGKTYKVTFQGSGSSTTWSVISGTDTLLKNQTNQAGDENYAIVNGVIVKVTGPPLDFKTFEVTANAAGPLNPPVGANVDFNGLAYPGPGTGNIGNQQTNGGMWLIVSSTAHTSVSYEDFRDYVTRYAGGFGEPNVGMASLVPDDFEFRFTATGSKGDILTAGVHRGEIINLPFEIWCVPDPNDHSKDFQVYCEVSDANGDGAFDFTGTDHTVSGGANDPYTDFVYMVIPKDRTPGSAGYNALLAFATANPPFDSYYPWAYNYGPPQYPGDPFASYPGMLNLTFCNWNGGPVPAGPFNSTMPETGTVFHIGTTKPNTSADEFTYTSPTVSQTTALQKADVEKVNVFPNPYYGFQNRETSPSDKYVTFSHLPANATIRIFDLSGVLVRTIKHNPANGQFDTWDLQNASNYPVASGVYVVYIEMPDLGITKILKLAIIQEQQMLKVY